MAPRLPVALSSALIALAIGTAAHAVKVRVRGTARIEASASPAAGGIVVSGTLRDDGGQPVPRAHLSLSFHAADETRGRAPLPLPPPATCGDAPAHPRPHFAPDEYVIDTDDAGAFCVRTTLPVARAAMRLRFDGTPLHEAAAAEIPVDTTARAVDLRFDPEPRSIALDERFVDVSVAVRLDDAERAPGEPARRVEVVLRDERGREVGRATPDERGAARFRVDTSALDGPGPGELRASFAGAPGLQPARRTTPVERQVRVSLGVPDAPSGELRGAAVAGEGAVLDVVASSSRGPVAGGAVEATIGSERVGAASVERGRASLAVAIGPALRGTTEVALRFVPDAPWWVAGAPVTVRVPLRGPSPWRRAPLIVLGVAVFVWAARGLRRSAAVPRPRPRPAEGHARGVAAVDLVTPGGETEGWWGRVVDAHDGAPVAGAVVELAFPAFEGESVHARVETDADGAFRLPPASGSVRLRVEARWHARLERPAPPPGEVVVALVTRRRRLLDRLVGWAERAGPPYAGPPEPTPAHVARTAGVLRVDPRAVAREAAGAPRAGAVQEWARAVESAAFGRGAVDGDAEERVGGLEPAGPARPADARRKDEGAPE